MLRKGLATVINYKIDRWMDGWYSLLLLYLYQLHQNMEYLPLSDTRIPDDDVLE